MHRNNEVERESPEAQEYLILLPGCSRYINVWATNEDEARMAAVGIRETDGALYGCE